MNVGRSTANLSSENTRRVLVLEGSGPVGPYQAGVYESLTKEGLEPDWLVGTSIGAVNAAIIAGNEPENRLPRLWEFWENVSKAGSVPDENYSSLTSSAITAPGIPSLFDIRTVPEDLSETIYDSTRLQDTFARLIDFDRINKPQTRLSIGAANAKSLDMDYFDNTQGGLVRLEHILAASAPPNLGTVNIGGELYFDGSVSRDRLIDYVTKYDASDLLIVRVMEQLPRSDKPEILDYSPDLKGANHVRVVQLSYRREDITANEPYTLTHDKMLEIWSRGSETAKQALMEIRPLGQSQSISPDRSDSPGEARLTNTATESSVTLMFATTRKLSSQADEIFSGERDTKTDHFGKAKVHIPKNRSLGQVNLPFELKMFGLTLYKQPTDPARHFVLQGHEIMDQREWLAEINASGHSEALVFVHGYNVSFLESVYRCAQIVWDIRYRGMPILFSWASRGRTLDYKYDLDSAELARPRFLSLMTELGRAGVRRIHILAHSMGNQSVLSALASHHHERIPLGIGELLMAAPDVDSDVFTELAPRVRKVTEGMTLYASSADRTMAISKRLAGRIPRAGDVPEQGPLFIDSVDTIDVTTLGTDIFGFNHSTFASNKSILNDVKLLLTKGIRPPGDRLAEIQGMPVGQMPFKWWRYVS